MTTTISSFSKLTKKSKVTPSTFQKWVNRIRSFWPWSVNTESGNVGSISVQSGMKSVTGNHRKMNQDRCYTDLGTGLFMVADGVGGNAGGEVASQILVEAIPKELRPLLQTDFSPDEFQQSVNDAIQAARENMIEFADCYPPCQRMCSTLALACVANGQLHVAHVGDSRVYLLRQGSIIRLTSDHSYVQTYVDTGRMTEEEARTSPFRHVVLNIVGVKPLDGPPDISSFELMPSDRIVLVTDGLTDVVDDETLHQIVMSHQSPQTAADALVAAALKLDSKDNVTCVVVQLASVDEEDICVDGWSASPVAA